LKIQLGKQPEAVRGGHDERDQQQELSRVASSRGPEKDTRHAIVRATPRMVR
jgi:hypothetical protein